MSDRHNCVLFNCNGDVENIVIVVTAIKCEWERCYVCDLEVWDYPSSKDKLRDEVYRYAFSH